MYDRSIQRQGAYLENKTGREAEKTAVVGAGSAVPAMKQELPKTISTYLTFCGMYGVTVRYETATDRELLEKERFEIIILACGALTIVPDIPGIKQDNVYLVNDILSHCSCLWFQTGYSPLGNPDRERRGISYWRRP